jgi:hypothetical protein
MVGLSPEFIKRSRNNWFSLSLAFITLVCVIIILSINNGDSKDLQNSGLVILVCSMLAIFKIYFSGDNFSVNYGNPYMQRP